MASCWPGHRCPSIRSRGALAGLLGLLLAISGCATSIEAPPAKPPAAQTGVDRPAGTGVDQRGEDERGAVNVVDRYWQRHFAELSRRSYRPPQVAGPYIGRSGPSCGRQSSVPGNAFYCVDGDFLAWDENLMRAGYNRIGDAWVYLIIAHEWGHAIQARLRAGQVSVAAELQADCFAGAALAGAVQDGDLILEPGDEQEISTTLAVVADNFPWTSTSSHGNAAQRTQAFAVGADNGLRACV